MQLYRRFSVMKTLPSVIRELEREDQANDWESTAATAATKDMSLKEGEKIKINIGGMVGIILE